MTLSRMRFGLNQLECNFPPNKGLERRKICEDGGKVKGVYVKVRRQSGAFV